MLLKHTSGGTHGGAFPQSGATGSGPEGAASVELATRARNAMMAVSLNCMVDVGGLMWAEDDGLMF
ncbi:hypothetical protein BC829DRAFT_381343 [Chytridium lagenaria]|nr:hypothetical protein BC829DRAFT_381343 [Chytridium lagenaria]